MKSLGSLSSLLPLSLLFLSPLPSLAVPPYVNTQAVFSQMPFFDVSGDPYQDMAIEWMDDAKKAVLKGKENLERWYQEGAEYIKQDNLLCENPLFTDVLSADIRIILLIDEYVTHPDFQKYNLRITEPKLCDPSVKQHSGYLDIAEDKHLFFW